MPDSITPNTHPSLLVRVKNPSDEQAWAEFVEIYWPVVYRLARQRGLQHADAEDLTQQVMGSVARAIESWDPDPKRGRFRAWLYRIAQNQIINVLTRAAPDRGTGDTRVNHRLNHHPAAEDVTESLAAEHRREVFRWAARQIRDEFQETTWQMFWRTAVEGLDIDEVANDLKKNRGAVYAARSRIMRRLKEQIVQFEAHARDDES